MSFLDKFKKREQKQEIISPINRSTSTAKPISSSAGEIRNLPSQNTNTSISSQTLSGRSDVRTADYSNANGAQPSKGVSHPNNKQNQIWPRFGNGVSDLIRNRQIRVFVTADFIRSAAFSGFSKEWHRLRVGDLATRYYFLPECESLTSTELTQVNLNDCQKRPGSSREACLRIIEEQHLGWNIVLLTSAAEIGTYWQKSAREHNIWLRWYGLDANGNVCSLQHKNEFISAPRQPQALFQFVQQPVKINRLSCTVHSVPTANSIVYAKNSGQTLRLHKAIMSDHRSITYSTSEPSSFAKIYTVPSLQIDFFQKKVTRMLQNPVTVSGVCWPKDAILDANQNFVGVLIPASRGIQLTASVLNGATGLGQYFPKWDKRDLCQLTITILRTVSRLEAFGLLFGCLNPATIYVVDPQTVYFVDMDAWQVEGFPALSRNRTFSPPEILSLEKPPVLSNIDTNFYQVAMLTFLLLMPGKFPYSQRKSADELTCITSRSFSFTIGGDRQRSRDAERPSGIWQIVWDHLSYQLCVQFYNSFHANGKNSNPGTRVSTETWLRLVDDYAKMLQERVDSRMLFPRTFRRDGKRVFYKCSVCGQEHPQNYFLHSLNINNERVDLWVRGYRVCLPCSEDKSDMSFTCQCCGETYYYTNRTKIMHEIGRADFDFKAQRWCRNCKKRTVICSACGKEIPLVQLTEYKDRKRNLSRKVCVSCKNRLIGEEKQWREQIWDTRQCRSCKRMFTITNGEYEFIASKGLNTPTRCKNCRGSR